MKIKLNGQPKELTLPVTLQILVDRTCKNNQNVIAEVNGHIIKRHEWRMKAVKEGDEIELVTVVGGG